MEERDELKRLILVGNSNVSLSFTSDRNKKIVLYKDEYPKIHYLKFWVESSINSVGFRFH